MRLYANQLCTLGSGNYHQACSRPKRPRMTPAGGRDSAFSCQHRSMQGDALRGRPCTGAIVCRDAKGACAHMPMMACLGHRVRATRLSVRELRVPARGALREQIEEVPKSTETVARTGGRIGHPQNAVLVLLKRRDAGEPA